jgi:eukaryotic-like serine/threonine-protein kinase
VEKALRYEPEQRYRSAQEFADDLQRWLDQRPVLARNGGRLYAMKKFVQRNRLAVVAGLTGLGALSFGLAFAWHQASLTKLEAERTRLTNRFLTDLISSADPNSDSKSERLIDAIDRAEKEIPERFAGQPNLEADVRLVVGRGYYSLNRLADAEKQFQRVMQISAKAGLERASALNGLADIQWSRGELDTAQASYRQSIAALDVRIPEQRTAEIDVSSSLDALLADTGRYEESITLAQANLAKLPERAVHTKAQGIQRAGLLAHYAYGLHGVHKTEQAVQVYQQALQSYERYLPADHPEIAVTLNNQAMALLDLGRKQEAVNLLQRSVDIRRARFGETHWMMVAGPANLAGLRAELGQFSESCALLQQAFRTAKVALEPNDPTWGRTINTAARIALLRGDKADAMKLAQLAIAKLTGAGVEPSYLARAKDTLDKARALPEQGAAASCALAL